MNHPHPELEEMTVAEMTAAMENGSLTSRTLVDRYLDRIEAIDRPLDLRSVIVTNPDAPSIADELDRERQAGRVRGPLHGIPILLKDNIDTVGPMGNTAGSLALADSQPGSDATVATSLMDAGAVIIGKANLSEWANFRSSESSSGWSAVGGACRNPYVLDRNPSGSSSGSGTAVSANLVAVAIGTETNGSIVGPAALTGIVGLKPTVGLTSRAGVVPIAHSQDTVGPMARTVADAAAVLSAIVGQDHRDPMTLEAEGHRQNDYTQFLDPEGLAGARIGVARQFMIDRSPTANAIMEEVLAKLADHGVVLVDPVEFPSFDEFSTTTSERDVLLCEFKTDLAKYLETRVGGPKTLAEIIAFNSNNADRELRWFGQETLLAAEATDGMDDPAYIPALATSQRLSREEGLDAVLNDNNLDAIIAPTGGPAWPTDLINGDHSAGGSASYAARAGYPLVTLPMGSVAGLPVGITFMGRRWAEPMLIRLASGFEAKLGRRFTPRFLPTIDRS